MTKSFINRRNFSEFASIEESFEVVSLIDEIKALRKNVLVLFLVSKKASEGNFEGRYI